MVSRLTSVDKDYWRGPHPHPLAPNEHDVEIYRQFLAGSKSRLLLGNTPSLMDLCTFAMDADPFVNSPNVIQQDWRTNTVRYDAIFGDGVLNFTEELATSLIDMAEQFSSVFIARVFSHKLPIMRVAEFFPSPQVLHPPPQDVLDFGEYRFLVWRFA